MKQLPATPEQIRARNERRRSGAAGLHKDRRDRRARTRQAQRQRWERDA